MFSSRCLPLGFRTGPIRARWSMIALLAGACAIPWVLNVACAMSALNDSFLGATVGGAQDIAFARQVIADGGIPDPESITVEGLLSEHSIEIEPLSDPGLLYTTAAVAWNDDFDALTPQATIQIGFGTTINAETFHRRPLNLCLVIDRSGSMADALDERTRTPKLDAVKVAIDRLLARLDKNDRVSVVSFAADPKKVLDPAPGDDVRAVKEALDKLKAKGETDVARGMDRGYRLVKEHADPARADRIFVFTDAQVNTGTEESKDFIKFMKQYAKDGIGATIFGVGTNFDEELAYDISQVRGGNLFYLNDYERIVTVFDEELDFLVTPVAYDVKLTASIPFSLDVADVYGLPNVDTNTHSLELKVPTLFLSNREGGGAIMIRLRPGAMVDFEQEIELALIELTYKDESDEPVEMSLDVSLPPGLDPDAAQPYFETDAVRRGVLLVNTALVLKNACEDSTYRWYGWNSRKEENYDRAAARLTEFLPYFDGLADGLEDQPSPTSRSLSQERALVEALLANIESRREDWQRG